MSDTTYKNRGFGFDCVRFGLDPKEPCWGGVQGSSRGLECKGHQGGSGYQTPADIQEKWKEATRQARLAEKLRKQEEKEAGEKRENERWFRPLLDRASQVEPTPFWTSLSDHVLKMVFSMFGDGLRSMDDTDDDWIIFEKVFHQVALPAIAEVARRNIKWPVGAYQLKLAPKPRASEIKRQPGFVRVFFHKSLEFDLTQLSNRELHIWHGCAAHVVDFSCLERGVREVILHLDSVTSKELVRRGQEPTLLFDLKLEHLA